MVRAGRPAVFLDRDGVLNLAEVRAGKPYPPPNAESLVITPEAPEALERLRAAGFILIAVTNQPDLARGTRSLENISAMNDKVRLALKLDDLLVCLHDQADRCPCRKPEPGLILAAAEKWGIDLPRSWLIGDRRSDILAGQRAGCRTFFLDYDYAEGGPAEQPDGVGSNLFQAVDLILRLQDDQ